MTKTILKMFLVLFLGASLFFANSCGPRPAVNYVNEEQNALVYQTVNMYIVKHIELERCYL